MQALGDPVQQHVLHFALVSQQPVKQRVHTLVQNRRRLTRNKQNKQFNACYNDKRAGVKMSCAVVDPDKTGFRPTLDIVQ